MIKEVVKEKIDKEKEKISKAERIRSLIQKEKSLMGSKQKLTDFQEPVLFLERRNGIIEFYEKVTSGKFAFAHSLGYETFLELRREDQRKLPYAGRMVSAYFAHEDRPFAGYENPVVDSESVKIGYTKTKATDLKYQERLEGMKVKNKMVWVWIIIAILGGLALLFTLTPERFWDRIFKTGSFAVQNTEPSAVGPTVGALWLGIKGKFK